MFDKQINRLADVLIEENKCKARDKEVIAYGMSSAIELFINILTVIMIGFLFGMIVESIFFLICFSFLRTYAGGYHCEKAVNCYLLSMGIIVSVLMIVKFIPTQYMLITGFTMLLISIPIILKKCPVETKNKPLEEVEKIYFRKKVKINLLIFLILAILFVFIQSFDLFFILSLAVSIAAFSVLLGKKIKWI